MLRLAGDNLEINTFVTVSNCFLKKMHKQGSKYRSIISVLNKIFAKHVTVFKVLVNTAANFIKKPICSACCFLLFGFYLFLSYFLVYLIVFLCVYHLVIVSVATIIVSLHLHLFMFPWSTFCTIILLQFSTFEDNGISAYNVVLFLCFVLLLIHLLVHRWIIIYISKRCYLNKV